MSALKQRKGTNVLKGVDFDMVGQTVWINHGRIALRITKNKEGGLTLAHTIDGRWAASACVINAGDQQ